MAEITKAQVEAKLQDYIEPHLGQDLRSAGAIESIDIDGDKLSVTLALGFPVAGIEPTLAAAVTEKLATLTEPANITVQLKANIIPHAVQQGVSLLGGVKNTIAVASGKGGVGKSTTAVNLALALQLEGAKVGLLDADIYGPSQPRMLGCQGKPEVGTDQKTILPKYGHGLQTMSIGYLIDEETPMVWRGPMVTSALQQLLGDTAWTELDYLVIDLPPGTGDIQLTLCQKIPVSTALIVTTPQDIALLDARKALQMFTKVKVPVAGIIENMSIHICSQCGHEEPIFGEGGGQRMAEQYQIELLGAIPLKRSIREGLDRGQPSVTLEPDSEITAIYRQIARKTAAKLSLTAKDYTSKFPKIVIENS